MQFGVLAVLLVLTLAGLPVAWKLRDTINDPIILAASAFWTGILGFTFLCFVLFHRVVYHALGWKTVAACPRLALAVMLIPAAWGLWLLMRRKQIRGPQPTDLASDQRPAILLAARSGTADEYRHRLRRVQQRGGRAAHDGTRVAGFIVEVEYVDAGPPFARRPPAIVEGSRLGLTGRYYLSLRRIAGGLSTRTDCRWPPVNHFGINIFHLGMGLAVAALR